MRRVALLFAGGALWLFLAAIPVLADGGPHVASINSGAGGITADSCAGCHRAHTAQGAMLLIEEEPAMCLVCHGASGTGATTDVETGLQYAVGTSANRGGAVLGALRNGGFIRAYIGSGSAVRVAYASGTSVRQNVKVPVASASSLVSSAHMPNTDGVLGDGSGPAWGNGALNSGAGATVDVTCTTCHNPHGNGAYRILNPIPAPTGTGFVKATTGVTVTDVAASVRPNNETLNYTVIQTAGGTLTASAAATASGGNSLAGDYFHRKVPWNGTSGTVNDAPNGDATNFDTQINAWCSTCHSRYLAITGTPFDTASGDATFKYRHSNTSNKPCTTCHVAHGSNAVMDGAYSSTESYPGGAVAPVGDSRLLKIDNRGTCQACHDPTGTITAGTQVGPTPNPLTP
ncbi:MAG: cytochrome c3 family protein [Chloroflexota bacterium]